MAKFVIAQPVETIKPEVVVDAGLKAGKHVFQLVVINDRGQASLPATFVVLVRPTIFQPTPFTPHVPIPPIPPIGGPH